MEKLKAHQLYSIESHHDVHDEVSDAFHAELDKVDQDIITKYIDQMIAYEALHQQRTEALKCLSPAYDYAQLDNFRTSLLAYLAGNVVVKDHRYRY